MDGEKFRISGGNEAIVSVLSQRHKASVSPPNTIQSTVLHKHQGVLKVPGENFDCRLTITWNVGTGGEGEKKKVKYRLSSNQ